MCVTLMRSAEKAKGTSVRHRPVQIRLNYNCAPPPHACENLENHPLTPECLRIQYAQGAVAELADAGDLKSSEGNLVWVRLPLAPPNQFLKYRTRDPIL